MRRVISSTASRNHSSSRRDQQDEEYNDNQSRHSPRRRPDGAAPPPMDASLVCMTVVQDGAIIAFACYDEDRNEIILECGHTTESDVPGLVERFLEITNPNLLLLGTKILNNAPLLQLLTNPSSFQESTMEEEAEEGDSSRSIPYRLMKSGSFDLRGCRARILQKLRVRSLLREEEYEYTPGYGDRRHRVFPENNNGGVDSPVATIFRPSTYHSLAAQIDFDSKAQLQALGSLVSYLQDSTFRLADDGNVTIDRIVLAKSYQFMRINAMTLSSLHIFSTEHHPLIAKGQGNSKEGWSLYSLLDRTKSNGGRKLLKEWMMRPLINLEDISERQNAVEMFLHPSLQAHAGILLTLLGRIGPMDSILLKLQKCATRPNDFLVMIKTLSAAAAINASLCNDIYPRLNEDSSQEFWSRLIHQCHADALLRLNDRITAVIDEEAMLEFGASTGIVIRRGFHPQLDEWKDQYEDLDVMLEEIAEDFYGRFPHLKDLSVIFVPQVGFLVCLDKQTVADEHVELPADFTHIFNQDDEAFFKNSDMKQLDQDIGDLDGFIKDTEGIIVAELEEAILEHESELRECFKALSQLDCILAFASCAIDLKFTRPKMEPATTSRIYIKDGRHPLQEIITETEFIPNHVQIDSKNRLIVISGPNYSGKSCYLRQVGLLVYMAHIGCFIPCSEAVISITDQICARISTVETCAVPQSSFQLDLTQMASILLRATSKSLVLIDEFGKGTSPASGIATLGAALKRLSEVGCKTVCTTHFLEIFSMDVIQDNTNGFKARRMAIHLPNESEDDATPLFKLEDGVASSSAGLICAKRAGLNQNIVNRAKEIIRSMRQQRQIAPLPEAIPPGFSITIEEIHMLYHFLSVPSWVNSSEDELRTLIQKIARV